MTRDEESLARLRGAIQELARHDAVEVVAEARAAARARVRSLLADSLAQAMLDRAFEEIRPAGGQADEQPPPRTDRRHSSQTGTNGARDPQSSSSGERAWYVYGVIAAHDGPRRTAGDDIHGLAAIETVSDGGLTAVVSQVPAEEFAESRLRAHLNDMTWVETAAREHERVLDALCRQTTVIPMRMCTVYETEGGVREMLSRESDTLVAALQHLEGKSEWGVKVIFERARFSRRAPDEAAPSEGGSGAAYMNHRRQERERVKQIDEQIEAAVAEIHESLDSRSDESTINPPQRPEVSAQRGEMVLNGAYLVRQENESQFHESAHALRAKYAATGLELVVTGPWPAYNFLPGTIGATW
jgi:Gas vesicle synthesis protein GvpL/GvpF